VPKTFWKTPTKSQGDDRRLRGRIRATVCWKEVKVVAVAA